MKKLFKKQVNRKVNTRKTFLLGLGVVLLGAVFMYVINQRMAYARPCGGDPNNKLYYEAAEVLKNGSQQEKDALVEKIKKIKNHDKDINCIYPLFKVGIQTGDFYIADSQYELLGAAYYKKKAKISRAYEAQDFRSLESAKAELDTLQEERSGAYNEEFF